MNEGLEVMGYYSSVARWKPTPHPDRSFKSHLSCAPTVSLSHFPLLRLVKPVSCAHGRPGKAWGVEGHTVFDAQDMLCVFLPFSALMLDFELSSFLTFLLSEFLVKCLRPSVTMNILSLCFST